MSPRLFFFPPQHSRKILNILRYFSRQYEYFLLCKNILRDKDSCCLEAQCLKETCIYKLTFTVMRKNEGSCKGKNGQLLLTSAPLTVALCGRKNK